MGKALIIYKKDEYDGFDEIGVFLDIDKGRDFIRKENIEYDKECELVSKCYECFEESTPFDDESNIFKYKDVCDRALIKTDRHGEYCKNKKDHYDIQSLCYSGLEINIMDN